MTNSLTLLIGNASFAKVQNSIKKNFSVLMDRVRKNYIFFRFLSKFVTSFMKLFLTSSHSEAGTKNTSIARTGKHGKKTIIRGSVSVFSARVVV